MKRYPRPGWVRIMPSMPLKRLLNYDPKIHKEDEELITTFWDELEKLEKKNIHRVIND